METSLHVEKSNVEKRPWGKKTGPKKKEMVPFCQEKKKIYYFVTAGLLFLN